MGWKKQNKNIVLVPCTLIAAKAKRFWTDILIYSFYHSRVLTPTYSGTMYV